MEGYHIVVKDGISHTFEGALDGGAAYLDQAVRNMMRLGVSELDAVAMASLTPAKLMGYASLGTIELGRCAHLTAWDNDWNVAFTVLEDGMHS